MKKEKRLAFEYPKIIKEKRLTIEYIGKVNNEMDDALKKLLKEYGWKWSGQGVESETGVRDIGFYKDN